MKYKNLPNYGYIHSKLPKKLFNSLLNECNEIDKKNNNKILTNLSGERTPNHYFIEKNCNKLYSYLNLFIDEYQKNCTYLNDIKMFKTGCGFFFDKPWLNIQKKYQFVPNHIHDGVFSYSIWMKIPYNLKEEIKKDKFATRFSFIYNSILGNLGGNFSEFIELSKDNEGDIIFFPSKLMHCVYPFYTTNKKRMCISGNILLNTTN